MVLTTAGRLHWLEGAIKSLRDPIDVLVVDDATPAEVGIGDFCQENKIHFITKRKPKGVTDSWNRAYQFFKDNHFQSCILSNDDVTFSQNFSRGLMQGLQDFNLVGPLSNRPGTGTKQQIRGFINITPISENTDQIQKALIKKYSREPFMVSTYLNGFCFAFSPSIKRFRFSDEFVFDPKNINTQNEGSLCRKVIQRGGKIAICKTSYVFHRKGVTLKNCGKDRNQFWR